MWNIWQAPILNFISGYYPAQYVAVHILTIATLKMSAVLWNVQTPRFWWKAMLYLSEKRNIVCSFRQDWHSIDAQVTRFGSLLALDSPQIDNRLAQELHWIGIKWQLIYTQVALTWQCIGIGLAALDWRPIGIGLATDNPRVSASAIVPNRCVHCTVLASIFLDCQSKYESGLT